MEKAARKAGGVIEQVPKCVVVAKKVAFNCIRTRGKILLFAWRCAVMQKVGEEAIEDINSVIDVVREFCASIEWRRKVPFLTCSEVA